MTSPNEKRVPQLHYLVHYAINQWQTLLQRVLLTFTLRTIRLRNLPFQNELSCTTTVLNERGATYGSGGDPMAACHVAELKTAD